MPTLRDLIAAALLGLAAVGVVHAQDVPARRTMTALPLSGDERLVIDGVFDEPAWARAEPATDFIQQDPAFGQPATERTEVRVLFDRERLYMGVTCFDSEPDKLLGFQRRRDEFLSADDRFMWAMDPYLDGRSGYFFEINPSGLMGDSLLGSGGQNNRQWDGIWTARVRRTDIGWVAEIEIPFRTLNFSPDAPAWGINFQRTVRRKSEESLWTGYARNQGLRRLSNAGLLVGIRQASQGRGLDLKPYALGTAFASPGRGQPDTTWDGNVGLDVFYSPTPRLRASFTLNTDFAQTEVDDRQVNLTRFSLFFEEKRDFFLEGTSFFDFRSNVVTQNDVRVYPFFSRRVGLTASREPQKIDFGARLTGQIGAQDIGIMHVRTGPDEGTPGDDFTVARVKRRVLAQSYVGGLLTRRAPRGDGQTQYTMGVDTLLATRNFMGSQNLEVGAFLLATTVPDGVRGGGLSYGLELDLPNDPWAGSFGFREVQDRFDPAVGFVARTAYRRYNPAVTYSPRPRGHRWIRRFSFGAALDLQTDLHNGLLTRRWDLKAFEVEAHTGDSLTASVIPQYERLEEDFDISPGVILPAGAEYRFTRYRLEAQTANRRIIAVRPALEVGDFFSGTRQEYSLALTLRARPGVIVYSEAEWNRVDLPEGAFNTTVFRLTPEFQFSPWMSLVNNIQYDNVSRTLGWQLRYRWILKPGNDLYFVYTHNWRDDPGAGLRTQEHRASTKLIYTHSF